MICIDIRPNRAVVCHAVIHVPLSAAQTWGQIRDFQTYARSDIFHADIYIEGGLPGPGANLQIIHRFFVFQVHRLGRICRWREFEGYAFSDLSRRDKQSKFPHIFEYRLAPISPTSCDLHLHVRGRWTARKIPRWIARLWLRWIMRHIARRVENQLLVYQVWMKKRKC